MKKTVLLFLLIFAVTKTQAQNYQIAFAATGASTVVDSVKVENITQCTTTTLSGSDFLHLTETVGINELNTYSNNVIRIYPNPMTGVCSVGFNTTAQSVATIGLYDITGKRILLVQELLTTGHHIYSLSGINRGIYLLKIESDKYFYTAKIVSRNEYSGTAEIKHIGTTPGVDNQSTGSNKGKIGYLKSGKSVIDMQYTTGDILKLTGKSGVYRTVYMLLPAQSQTVTFNFVACTDADNNHYAVVQIGTQIWMAENLKTSKYSNGISIPGITDNTQWSNLSTGAYSDYNNTPGNSITFGKLYNFYSIEDSRNICPNGWHVPADAELTTLTTYLGSESNAGGFLKEKCTTLWQSPNAGAINSSGFSALPGGFRDNNDGGFYDIGIHSFYWSATANGSSYAWYRLMYNTSVFLMRHDFHKKGGFSVRCVRDDGGSTSTPTVTPTAVTGITQTTAISGGNVTSDGGATVTARGVCWNTSANPTTANSKTTDGTGTGAFVSSLTGLTPNTPYYIRAYASNSVGTTYGNEVSFTTLSVSGFTCNSSVTINHVAGVVAPVNKTVTYGTVTNIPGEPTKCWITSNLGANQQSTAANDATEASAGWYWQFNRKQGYKHDGTTRTPSISWVGSFSENSDWIPANDPCTIELGGSWHIPTSAEWTNVDAAGNWTSWNGSWNSGLKLHAAGYLRAIDGVLFDRGVFGASWSNMQETNIWGRYLNFNSGECYPYRNAKYYGFPVRCVRDAGGSTSTPTVTTTAVTGTTQTSTTSGGNVTSDGGATVTARGVCWNTSPNPTTANRLTTDGSGTGTFVSNLTGLSPGTPYYVRAYATNSVGTAYGNEVGFTTLSLSGFTCGSSITVNHVAGVVAPVAKSVTYGTVTNIPGEPSKCWITSNLGADHQATGKDDATEASAGWYWQFNRKQGYKHDGSTRTPNTTWITPVNENLDWQAANDPCTIELGSGWRIPTSTEWTNVDASGNWTDLNGPWNSALKIHAAGDLYSGNGSLYDRGSRGYYWSRSQDSDYGYGRNLNFSSDYSLMDPNYKASGISLRCLRDAGSSTSTPTVTTTAVTSITQTTATSGGSVTSDGGATVTARGVCWSISPNPTTANSKTTDGSGTGVFVSSLTGLTPNTPYYTRAYATNNVGTAYGSEVSFTTLTGSTCDSLTINHVVSGGVAPVDKTITYHTVTNIPGEPTKCWITSNLGASRQATAVNDATETSAGWYWQFNRKQGYKHDGATRTPNTTWINSISESSDWTAANDPCAIELGSGWRIPTSTEWANVDTFGTWTNWNGPWNSGLKLHAAGYLETDGLFYNRGVYGHYWSNTQNNAASASNMYLYNTLSEMVLNNKPYGFSLRCLKDAADKKFLVDTVINSSLSEVIITVKNKIKVEIPKGTVLSNSRLTIEEVPTSIYPEHEIYKTHFIYNHKIAGQTTFNDPIKITFNYNPSNLESGWTKDRLGTAYYNDTVKAWITYPDTKVDSLLNQITFTTNHLTPLSFTEFLTTGGYQHKFENDHFILYYTYEGSNKVCDNTTYNDNQSQTWHITSGPEKNTPFYIQDLAHWLSESWIAFNTNLLVPTAKINVYVRDIGGSYGYTGGGYIYNTYINITNDVGSDVSNPTYTRSNLLQGTAAHEMLHMVQGMYNNMTYAVFAYRWWMEALATQADRMVWGDALQRNETEFWCNKSTGALGNVLCHSLAFSWDKPIDWDWYAAGGFLSYLTYYRNGLKLDLINTVKAGSSANNRNYIDNDIRYALGGSSIGSEYLCYVQWLYEKRHDRQQLPTVQYSPDNPMVLDATLTTTNNIRKCSESSMPFLSARLIKIKNTNIETNPEFEMTVSKPDPAIRIFLYEYMDKRMQIVAELNDKEKRNLTINKAKSLYDILIVNTSKDNNLPFDVTIAQKELVLPAGTARLGTLQFIPDSINFKTLYNMFTIKSAGVTDGTMNVVQRGSTDGIVKKTLKITWNQPPAGNYEVVDGAVFWRLNLIFEFQTIADYDYVNTPNINIKGLSGTEAGASGGYSSWRPSLMEPNFCLKLAPDNFSVVAGNVHKYSLTKSYDISLKLDCGSSGGNTTDGYITFPIKINNFFAEDFSVILNYLYLRD